MMDTYNVFVDYNTSYKNPTRFINDSEEVSFANVRGRKGRSNSYMSGRVGV